MIHAFQETMRTERFCFQYIVVMHFEGTTRKKLEKRWDPKSREDTVNFLMKFMRLRLEDIHTKPLDWLAHTERKNHELTNAGYIMDDEAYLTYVEKKLGQFSLKGLSQEILSSMSTEWYNYHWYVHSPQCKAQSTQVSSYQRVIMVHA